MLVNVYACVCVNVVVESLVEGAAVGDEIDSGMRGDIWKHPCPCRDDWAHYY